MKKIIFWIIFILLVFAIGAWIISNNTSSRRSRIEKEKIVAEKKQQIENTIRSIVNKHNAVVDWQKSIKPKKHFEKIFTVRFEEVLKRNDGRPILFFAQLKDVVKSGNKYFIYFSDYYYMIHLTSNIYFVLECDSSLVKDIIKQPIDFDDRFAVIASILSVRRPNFEISAYQSDEEPEIVVKNSDVLIATGLCLDLLYVGEHSYEVMEKFYE